jgi:hypothetical protein
MAQKMQQMAQAEAAQVKPKTSRAMKKKNNLIKSKMIRVQAYAVGVGLSFGFDQILY